MNPAWRARPTLLTLLVALALALGSLALPTRADAATTHVSISGASSTYSDVAKTLTLTWKVGSTGHKGTVTLQRKSGKTWKKVKSVKTSSKGVAKVKVKPSSTTTYRVKTSSGKTSKTKKLTVHAAYTLTSTAGSTIMAGTSKKFNVYYHHDGKAVTSATVALERKSGSKWVKVSNVKVAKGKGSVTVKPTVTTTYRFRKPSVVTSATHKVTVKPPSSFTITGSGSGHGVGMSQYGAYEMALEGKSAASILSYYYPKTTVGPVNNPSPTIYVQVFGAGSDTAKTTTISIDQGTWQLVGSNDTVKRSGTGKATISVSASGSTVKGTIGSVSYSDSKLYVRWSGSSYLLPTSTATTATVAGAHGKYRNGELVLTGIGGQANVVNAVLLNTEYLYGVDEMPSSWGTAKRVTNGVTATGAAALQAQAIAARTYALNKVVADHSKYTTSGGVDPKCGCDVYDDTRSQNYTGWTKQGGSGGSTWVAAVTATIQTAASTVSVVRPPAGIAGSFAETPFFAATGRLSSTIGGTANNKDAFGTTAIPYLVHLTDPYTAKAPGLPASDKKWTDSISQATAKKIFGYTTVRSIAVAARYSSGQIKTLTATSDTGSKKSVTKIDQDWRAALGVKATWISSISPKK